ncbi:MAG TPA: aldose 1-epimerase [Chitinophagales bacterium]|nr:aldose 1-epimerase [Chitinophagales bacterium]HMW11794.1 aldose 1-epimerase [Chitinophagales bacterium]HMX59369.1 aldose 1-epimerase [Chitinophagales bacterium]HMY22885.1 aldose 1-epimerase [Chitinophagales bacterium]HNA38661.1 aldose 1-epimerase [Chitinophagales bacterium]
MHTIHQQYENIFEIITLANVHHTAKVVVNIGNSLFSYTKNRLEYLHFPFDLQEYANNDKLAGNPFMHPWANRLESNCIRVENLQYNFPIQQQHLLYRDGNQLPLHGLLLKSNKWKTITTQASASQCKHVAAYIFDGEDELSIFPFLHNIQMTHILRDDTLHIETVIHNLDKKDMPISFGFHPYFKKLDAHAKLHLAASNKIETNSLMIPTGQVTAKEKCWNFINHEIAIDDVMFDDGFQDLLFENGMADFSLDNIHVLFCDQYPFAQVYSPSTIDKPYVCIEPMTAPTNALNSNACQLLKSNETFSASFSIKIA